MNELIPWANVGFDAKACSYAVEALKSTWISDGPFVKRFEREFCDATKSQFGITTSNGTTALHLALMALGIGPGDEIIMPGFTFAAPANMTIWTGAKPVFAEIDATTWLLDPDAVGALITSRTKAIIAVHLYGNACELESLSALAKDHGLSLIEDAAEACFTRYAGKPVGSWGRIGCFSFQATKTISMGEGGFVITGEEALHARMRLIRNHGMEPEKRYWHKVPGHNFRLTNLQAALGCAQMERIHEIVLQRAELYALYRQRLAAIDGIQMQTFLPKVSPVVWTLAIKLEPHAFPERDEVIVRLQSEGVETRPGFFPFSEMPLYAAPPLPICQDVGRQVLCLPFFPGLSEEAVYRVCDLLLSLKR